MENINSEKILSIVQETIKEWHKENESRTELILTENIKKIREHNCHREDVYEVIKEVVITNTEMWHEEDKVRSERDEVVLAAIRNINPLNQHRNDLIEEVDEIFIDYAGKER